MKKIFTAALLLSAISSLSASNLKVTYLSGESIVLDVKNLTLTTQDSQMKVLNDENEFLLDLSELAGLKFVNEPVAINEVMVDSIVDAYDSNGIFIATFPSVSEAKSNLTEKGVYLLRCNNHTIKFLKK